MMLFNIEKKNKKWVVHFLGIKITINPKKKFNFKRINLNSKQYWNTRFSTKNWQELNGEYQTIDNTNASIEVLPEYIKNEIKKCKMSWVEFGCALGDGVNILSKEFEECNITGVDIAEEGISIAKDKFPHLAFIACDLLKSTSKFDVLYSSNVFEHFTDPFGCLKRLSLNINNYLIIIVPYNEKLYRGETEHVFSFNEKNLPKTINNNFKLIYSQKYHINEILPSDKRQYYKYFDCEQFIFIYERQLDK